MYKELEEHFNVIYPENKKSTYMSLLNYSDDLLKPMQRWYRYKEGFSIDLVKNLICTYCTDSKGIILDPFLGSGSTIIAANQLGYKGIGFEVNPFSHFLATCKLRNYSEDCVDEFESLYSSVIEMGNGLTKYKLPKLSFSCNVFEKEIEEYFMSIKTKIDDADYKFSETKDLLILGWLSCLEYVSNYKKAGNGLKKRKYVKPRNLSVKVVHDELYNHYSIMLADIKDNKTKFDATIYKSSCIDMKQYIKPNSLSGIVFSPPYANCFDYTEIYKLELWFGQFVSEYSDLRSLRKTTLRSHLNSNLTVDKDLITTDTLNKILLLLCGKKLWDKKIPLMLKLYFNDMFKVIDECYSSLKKNGFCSIVVGNSAYGNVIFPTDLILAEYAESIGFIVDKIEVDRYIITSSQQYKKTKQNGKYLRESVICLIKK